MDARELENKQQKRVHELTLRSLGLRSVSPGAVIASKDAAGASFPVHAVSARSVMSENVRQLLTVKVCCINIHGENVAGSSELKYAPIMVCVVATSLPATEQCAFGSELPLETGGWLFRE
jgi:hypothetical protein